MGMDHFEQVIFEEAHSAYDALSDAVQVVLHHREIEKDLQMDFLKGADAADFGKWKVWASIARVKAEAIMASTQERIKAVATPKAAWLKQFTHMRNLSRRLGTLSLASSKDWVSEEIDAGWQFDPIFPGKYSEASLFMRMPRVILVSATIRPKTMYMLGVSKDRFDFVEYDSDFDPARCPIYYKPTMPMDYRHPDTRPMWILHDQFAGRRQDRKGLVHTISYARQEEVRQYSQFAANMLINPKGEAPTSLIETFLHSDPGTELVSPSITTGYDFPGAHAEWQMITKIPFDPPSKIMKAREQVDKEYRSHRAAQKLQQMAGRLMRSKKDRGETIMGDDHLDWFVPRYGHLFSKSFHKFYKKVGTVPPPPEKL
jgi:Rad3-related DNA helicase